MEYVGKDCLLHRGDAYRNLARFPADCIDATITDPPYGMSLKTDRRSRGCSKLAMASDFPAIIGDDKPFDAGPLLRRNSPVIVLFGANWYPEQLPASGGWLVWDKIAGLPSKREVGFSDQSEAELAWTNKGNAIRIIRYCWMGIMKDGEHAEKRVHPTQKPIDLMVRIIKHYTKPGDVVFDPFMGSGSFGVACVKTGRRYVGVELNRDYYAAAKARIARAVKHQENSFAALLQTGDSGKRSNPLFPS